MAQTDKNITRKKKEIIIVLIAAIVVIAIASVFVIDYFVKTRIEETRNAQLGEHFSQYVDEVKDKSEKLRETISHDIPGNYILKGEVDTSDPSKAYSAIQILPDGTVSGQTIAGEKVSGWWKSQKSESAKSKGVELVAVLFPIDEEPTLYAVWNNALIDWKTVYFGKVLNSDRFDSTFVSAFDTGTMTINIKADGKAEAEFVDTNEKSENKGLKYVYGGNDEVENGYMDITLNSAMSRFLMFDYNIENSETDSGIAPVFYEKQE